MNGATNAACTTDETALTSDSDKAAYCGVEAAAEHALQDQLTGAPSIEPAMPVMTR